MKALALGLVTVPTAGTPVPLTPTMVATAGGGLPPSNQVYRIDFHARANTGVAYLKEVSTGNIIKMFPVPASGFADCFTIDSDGGDEISIYDFAIDAATNNDGLYVTAWVR